MTLTRRRFLTISAIAATLPGALAAAPARHWTGQALGARASIRLDHPQAEEITARCLTEIDRLENILSLYRADSALSRLNRSGRLGNPPFELLEILSLAGAVHHASGGAFDVTLQPLWALWVEAAVQNRRPTRAERAAALALGGWNDVALSPQAITLRPGMALTLNGIGQGYVADRVAVLLEAEGLTNVLIDTGELRALGERRWPVRIQDGDSLSLSARALATSAPQATCFDANGQDGHILDPRTGRPVVSPWTQVTVSAPSAALADALSTAACLTTDWSQLDALVTSFNDVQVEAVQPTF